MGQAQINVRTRACSRTSIARTKQAALTHNVRGKELTRKNLKTSFQNYISILNPGRSHFPHDDPRLSLVFFIVHDSVLLCF